MVAINCGSDLVLYVFLRIGAVRVTHYPKVRFGFGCAVRFGSVRFDFSSEISQSKATILQQYFGSRSDPSVFSA